MVQGYVVNTTKTPMRGMWTTSTTIQSSVHLTYHYQRELSESEATSRKLDAILYAMSSEMGVWEKDGDEDIPESVGDC
jgi:hypothetical protein